jgi:hypothetical protein
MDLYHLRQGLHVIASSWDYHGGARSRVSVRGNSVRFNQGLVGLAKGCSVDVILDPLVRKNSVHERCEALVVPG